MMQKTQQMWHFMPAVWILRFMFPAQKASLCHLFKEGGEETKRLQQN